MMMTMMQLKTPPLPRLPLPSHVTLPPAGILYLVLASAGAGRRGLRF